MKFLVILLLLCASYTTWASWSSTIEDLVLTRELAVPVNHPSPIINSDGSVMMFINDSSITAYGKLPNSDWSVIGELLISDPRLSDYSSFDMPIAASASLEKFVAYRDSYDSSSGQYLAPIITTFSYSDNGWSISESTLGNLSNVSIENLSISKNGQRIAISYYSNPINNNFAPPTFAVYENLLGGWVPVGEPTQFFSHEIDKILLDENGDNLVIIDRPRNWPTAYDGLSLIKIFTYSNGTWNQKGNKINPSGNFDRHGEDVHLSSDGQRIAISSPYADYEDAYTADNGRVDIYQFDNSNWQLITRLYGDDAGDLFGFRFRFSDNGNRIAIGSFQHNEYVGHIKVFDYDSSINNYTQVGNDINGSDIDFNDFGNAYISIGLRFNMSGDGTTIISMSNPDMNYRNSDGIFTDTLKTYEYSAPTDESLDSDGDGLTNATELSLGTNPNLTDTDGDGFPDGWEVTRNLDPTVNSSDFINNINAYGYYTTDQIKDLRAGSTMIEVEDGQATLSMEVEQSDDLEIWTSGGTTNLQVPVDPSSDTKFFRFKMAE